MHTATPHNVIVRGCLDIWRLARQLHVRQIYWPFYFFANNTIPLQDEKSTENEK